MDIPTETEIHDRLEKLRGIPSATSRPGENHPALINRDRRSDVEKTHDLVNQMQEEVNVDSKMLKPEDDIAMRLAKLRDEPVPSTTTAAGGKDDVDPAKFVDMDVDPVDEAKNMADLNDVLNKVRT